MTKNGYRHWLGFLVLLGYAVSCFGANGQERLLASGLDGRTIAVLPEGQLFLAGGQTAQKGVTDHAALIDPHTGEERPLTLAMQHARAFHSAVVLPNGSVLILGGVGGNGHVVSQVELFDPATQRFASLPMPGLTPRAYHTATLLTDGRVLVAGGIDATGAALSTLEVWDFRTGQGMTLPVTMLTPRSKHTATLLADGTVLFWGGVDANGNPLSYGEVFDPKTQTMRMEATLPQSDSQPLRIAESIPANGAIDVPASVLIALRFSKPLRVETVNSKTVALSSSGEAIKAKVVPAEGGMLAFITPEAALQSGTVYTLSVSGPNDNAGQRLPDSTITFTTAGGASAGSVASGSDAGLNSPWRKLPALQAEPGMTALAGQVLKLNGEPLPHVLIEIGKKNALTDKTGRFLLRNLEAGHQIMYIDGAPANAEGAVYGLYRVGVDIDSGRTNALNYTIWMTPLDTEHVVRFPSPTTSDIVVTNPDIPGLELHIPADTVIRDARGRIVTEIGITPIPMNQPPFPLKRGVVFPVYFTIQPGGASFSTAGATWSATGKGPKGAQIYYQNYPNSKAGTRFDFWNYDPAQKGWYVYGKGRVSQDRKMIVPDNGTQIWSFDGAMVSNPGNAPPTGPKGPDDGDPVNLQTGLFVYRKTDLVLPDVIPIVLRRTYRQGDSISRAFGIGANFDYDMFMVGDDLSTSQGYTYQDLVLADGSRIHFTRTSPCDANGYCGYGSAVYMAGSDPGAYYGATLKWGGTTVPGAAWTLTTKDGTVYEFRDSSGGNARYAAVMGIHDRYGNALTFTRDSNSNLLKITSTNGRWIQFTYDTSNRVTEAQDNIGRKVIYTYDTAGRLETVKDANGGITTYTYDADDNMKTIKDARGIVYLTNDYDSNGRVWRQTQADTGTYQFSYDLDSNGNVTSTTVTDPRSYRRMANFNSDGYMVSDTHASGTPEQQTTNYSRQQGTGLLLSVTDALNRRTSYTYDSKANITSITRLAGTADAVTTRFTYEPKYSQLASITDPLGHTTSFTFDDKGNAVAVTDPLGNTSSITYNSSGQPLTITDPMGNPPIQFSYEGGDLVGMTDSLGRSISAFIDSAGRRASMTDPLGRITRYNYDPLNQITAIIDPAGNETSFTYDENGNLRTVKDAKQHTTTYTYNSMDRLETRQDPLGNPAENYVYDKNGNLTQFTDRRGKVTTYDYDGLNRMKFVGFGMQAGPSYESSISYIYDKGNRPTLITDSASGTITPEFDDLNRLKKQTTPQGVVTYTYDLAGRRQTMLVAGQPVVNYTFDEANRLTQITQGNSIVEFSYDNNGRRTSLTLPNGVVMSYSYDAASQLTGISYQAGSISIGDLAYGYDLAGRRSSVTGSLARTGLPSPIATAVYNDNNQLAQWGMAALSYDPNGNLLSDGTNSFVWDARNQLASMNNGGASFQYDPLGRRTGRTTLGTTTNYLYDGINPVQELSGGAPIANLLTGGLDEYFTRADNTGTYSFLNDGLGSTLALTDATGALQTQYTYEPFGTTSQAGTSTTNSFAYTGREFDATGLYYYRARYYDPAIGRFISEDPIGFGGGDANLYSYVWNSPTNFFDPVGQWGWPVHVRITNAARQAAGLPLDPGMAQQVAAVDFRDGSQGTDANSTNTHSMAGMSGRKPQDCQQAFDTTKQQIIADVDSGDLTKALHTIQDAYSPSHYPFKFWDGGYTPWHIPGPIHVAGDYPPPGSPAENAATAASTRFLKDILDRPNGPVDPTRYLPQNPCRQ